MRSAVVGVRSAVTAAGLLGLLVLGLLGLLLLLVFVECSLFYIVVIILLLVLHPSNSQGPGQEKNSGDTGGQIRNMTVWERKICTTCFFSFPFVID